MSASRGSSLPGVKEMKRSVFSYGPSCARSVIAGRPALKGTGVPFASRRMKGRTVLRSTGKLNVTTISFVASGTTSCPEGVTETISSGSVRKVKLVSPTSGEPSSERSDPLTAKVYSVAGARAEVGSKARRRDPYQRYTPSIRGERESALDERAGAASAFRGTTGFEKSTQIPPSRFSCGTVPEGPTSATVKSVLFGSGALVVRDASTTGTRPQGAGRTACGGLAVQAARASRRPAASPARKVRVIGASWQSTIVNQMRICFQRNPRELRRIVLPAQGPQRLQSRLKDHECPWVPYRRIGATG